MPRSNEDPLVTSARREAWLTFFIWTVAAVWSVSYCYTHGYNRGTAGYDRVVDPQLANMEFYFGWPDWVFWGILVPWGTCTVVSAVFAFFVMQDAPLGEDRDDEEDLL